MISFILSSYISLCVVCVEDYRRTACVSLLKYIAEKERGVQGEETSHSIQGMSTFYIIVFVLSVAKKKRQTSLSRSTFRSEETKQTAIKACGPFQND